MFTLVTLVAAVLLSQSVYLGLAWQVCMTDVSLHLSSYVSCRGQCVCAISLLLSKHLTCFACAGRQVWHAGVLWGSQEHWVSAALVGCKCCPRRWS